MKDQVNSIRYFLFSQYIADGIRITGEIVLPVIILAQLGHISMGFTMALGALCVSISDAPGPVEHKRNGMMYCNLFVFIMALLTGFINDYPLLMGLLVMMASFFFTMLSVFGNRAAAIGTAALLVMILKMPVQVTPAEAVLNSFLVLAGGTWYMLVALVFFRFTPYRPAQRALGDCIHETARILKIKAALYDIHTDFSEEYRKLVSQQIIVVEKQDALRELLYKNRALTKESTRSGKILLLAFSDLMDLYEQIHATWFDYESLRNRFAHTGILPAISHILENLGEELDQVGFAIQSFSHYSKTYDLLPALEQLKQRIDTVDDQQSSNLALKKILVNLRNIGDKMDELTNYFRSGVQQKRKLYSQDDYGRFVSHQQIDLSLLRNNLHIESAVFRHALRMMTTCSIGFLIAQLIPSIHYSYWILLTIIIILKPGFGLTKQRNKERLLGTIAGGFIGVVILAFISDRDILFALIIFFMIGTYTYQRWNYGIMVIFTTPYVIILFHLLGLGSWNIAQDRLLDTGIGCTLAFLANYLLFPHWESRNFRSYMTAVIKANISYLGKLADKFWGQKYQQLNTSWPGKNCT